jgi:LPS-assembly lipoprotein
MRALLPILLVGAAISLAACGFHPLYGHTNGGPGVAANFSTVYIPPIELESAGYELRNDLLDGMQAKSLPDGALYDLKINLRDRNQPIAIQNQTVGALKEVEITRYNYTLIADYQLVERKTQKMLTKGTESSLSAYDVVASPYATLVAQKAAQANTAQDIAQNLRLRLGIFFTQLRPQQ